MSCGCYDDGPTDPHYAELEAILRRSDLGPGAVKRALECAEQYGQAFSRATRQEIVDGPLAAAQAEVQRLNGLVTAVAADRDEGIGYLNSAIDKLGTNVERRIRAEVKCETQAIDLVRLRAVRDASTSLLSALPRCNDGDCQGVRTWGTVEPSNRGGTIHYYGCDLHGGPGTFATTELSYAPELRRLLAAVGKP